jgi:starch synthase (maltosyl-transferring)
VDKPPAKTPPPRIRIQDVEPTVDCGRSAPKRSLGETVVVEADIFRDGHEQLRAAVVHRPPGGDAEVVVPMTQTLNPDRWRAEVALERLGLHELLIEAWIDPWATWRTELERKVGAGQEDLSGELAEGRQLLVVHGRRLKGEARAAVREAAAVLGNSAGQDERVAAAIDPALTAHLEESPARPELTRAEALRIDVDRELARCGAWYELFPRSFGGFAGVERHLPRLADLGFDVVYLTPVHPIGRTHRKGRNNAPVAEPGDPGSPWAIGAPEGGHEAVHPELGTMDEFVRMCAAARDLGLEIALDFAIQCSPDHPWIGEHPEWFYRRPDGTLKYAENPPKRYQDIYNLDLGCEDWRSLWEALRDIVELWVERGVSVFRVDNPHTKPIGFWEWLIGDVRSRHPEVVFLAEAFTRPAMMLTLAAVGFSQSYTYFTWRNGRAEIQEYVEQLASPPWVEVYRPNFFANTPDILHAYLQEGGRPAFEARLVLAATLSPSYGIYSGFEHCENVPVRPGSEEYLNSEKYEVRARELDGPLLPLAQRLNEIRRSKRALRWIRPVRFLETLNPDLLAYVRGEGPDAVVVVVNLDPRAAQEGVVDIPGDVGLPPDFRVRDLLTGTEWGWHWGRNYVRLDPAVLPAHVMGIEP